MSYVGEVILSAREAMTDLPQTFPTPVIIGVSVVAGGGLPVGPIWGVVTLITLFGETYPSTEFTATTTAGNQNINIAVGFPGPASVVNIVAARIYIGFGAGAEQFYQQVPVPSNSVIGTDPMIPSVPATPPTRSTAYLPDTDGAALGAYAIYRMLNQGLAWAAAKNRGGLPDFGAVGTTNGQPNYVLPGYWKKIDSAWFDGYPLGLLAKNNVFRRNPVPGYSGMLVVFQATDRLMVEAWPQPNRTSCQTQLAAPMGLTDTVANVISTSQYVLGFGMTQIGSEIVNFSAINGNQLQGLQRGMCGTVPATHAAFSPVTELNLMIAGYRVPATYSVGQSNSTFYLPPGWDEALTNYILHRFRKLEQDEQGAASALKEAEAMISSVGANRIIAGPRQISPYSSIGPEVGAGLGTAFGGVIIP